MPAESTVEGDLEPVQIEAERRLAEARDGPEWLIPCGSSAERAERFREDLRNSTLADSALQAIFQKSVGFDGIGDDVG